MRFLIVAVAFITFAFAGFLGSVIDSHRTASIGGLLVGIVLTLSFTLSHTAQVSKWLTTPARKQADQAERLRDTAQEVLTQLVSNKKITEDRLSLFIHVWVVPNWYRTVFPYPIRNGMKWIAKRPHFARLAGRRIRPKLIRMAAVGLVRRNSTFVRFTKDKGVVGLCLTRNDQDAILAVDLRQDAERDALGLTEQEWATKEAGVTRNLELAEALKLATRYGEVIACVIQTNAGEAIGCVTISVRPGSQLSVVDNHAFHDRLKLLALAAQRILA